VTQPYLVIDPGFVMVARQRSQKQKLSDGSTALAYLVVDPLLLWLQDKGGRSEQVPQIILPLPRSHQTV